MKNLKYLGLVGMVLGFGSVAGAGQAHLQPSWRATLEAQKSLGRLTQAKTVDLVVWNKGYHDESAEQLAVTVDGVAFPFMVTQGSKDEECHSSLRFAEATLTADVAPWVFSGERLRFIFWNQAFNRCWEIPVQSWELKIEVYGPDSNLITEGDYKGQPSRISTSQ